MIYADNAATTQLDMESFEAMKPYLLEKYGNSSQPYSFSRASKVALNNARREIAKIINADEDEIFFTSGGSESDNWALKCFGTKGVKKNIITSKIEHHAILNTCKELEHYNGTEVYYLNVDKKGVVDINELEIILSKKKKHIIHGETTLVSIMLANNEIGTIEPIKQLADISHAYGAYFHTDAVQAVGHISIDVKDLGVDMLSASAHKFNGPKGIGFLYVKKGTSMYSLINGGSQENGMRGGTENIAAIVGMAVALKNNVVNMKENQKKLKYLEKSFIDTLQSLGIDFIKNGSNNNLPGLVNISIKKASGEMLLHRLDLKGCCISTGSACDSVNTQISHVIRSICIPMDYAEGTIRVSFGKYNSPRDGQILALNIYNIIK